MKTTRHKEIPMPVCVIFAALIICLSFSLTGEITLPEKLVCGCIYSAVPDVLSDEIYRIKMKFISEYTGADMISDSQKSGSMTDLYSDVNLSDLSATPADIISVINKLKNDFSAGEYAYDGAVTEITYTTQQSTDNYGVVSVRNVTESESTSIEERLSEPFFLPVTDLSAPLVLVYHTHTTESYIPVDDGRFSSAYPTRNSDKAVNMVKVGDELCAVLEANGIKAIHDRTVYDEKYNGAYEKSRQGIERILQKYPSIIITLDIHRDAIYYDDSTRIKPVTVINGKKAAQMMIISGAEGGNITAFPDWQTNFAFALRLQQAVNSKYESLMKPLYFCNRKYNMDVTPYSLLVEVGTDVNTLEEATHSARLLGDCMAMLIKENSR